jgi:hypothetical protein
VRKGLHGITIRAEGDAHRSADDVTIVVVDVTARA